MSFALTPEQVLSLAPDAASAKNGQKLATPHTWPTLGSNEQAVWGECKGSGKTPYKVQVDLTTGDLAYRCSCPSRKLPCKHTLGLLVLRAQNPDAFTSTDPPAWVAEWLAKRAQAAEKRATSTQQPAKEQAKQADPAAKQKRAEARDRKVRDGLDELERWLYDLVRQGLSQVQGHPASFWHKQAARLVDAQAPGVARMVRELAALPASGAGWQERLLARLSRLHLLIAGYQRLDTLPPALQDDIRTAIGITTKESDLRELDGIRDRWLVVGQTVEEEDSLRAQRTWLWGTTQQRAALELNFAHGKTPLTSTLLPGTAIDAELVYYPGSYPLRAVVKTHHAPPVPFDQMWGAATINDALGTYATALAHNPWIERLVLLLDNVVVVQSNGRWFVQDQAGHALPVAHRFGDAWHILAHSGGQPVTLAGEWDGTELLPPGMCVQNTFVAL